MTSEEIKLSGERHVRSDLTSKGFFCVRNKWSRTPTGIEAIMGTEVALVYVTAAAYPNLPTGPSAEESGSIRKRAARMDWEAWLAHVQIDDAGKLLEPITYARLI
jgi:hypothetical protein